MNFSQNQTKSVSSDQSNSEMQSLSEGEESQSSEESSDNVSDSDSDSNILNKIFAFYSHNHSNSCKLARHTRGAPRREIESHYPTKYCNSGGGFGCQPSVDSDDEEDSPNSLKVSSDESSDIQSLSNDTHESSGGVCEAPGDVCDSLDSPNEQVDCGGQTNEVEQLTQPPPTLFHPSDITYFQKRLKCEQDRIMLIHHGQTCNIPPPCHIDNRCAEMKALIPHCMTCQSASCEVDHCKSTREVLHHITDCPSTPDKYCSSCEPLREKIQRRKDDDELCNDLHKRQRIA
jgi:hypothetical protein